MRSLLKRLHIEPFMLAIVTSAVVASLLPARGPAVPVLNWVVIAAIALLFFLYGARLHPREALKGLTHWRLHLTILACTFVAFPLLGLLVNAVTRGLLSDGLRMGLFYVSLVPSTVQSSIAFTSIARGNVPGAIVSASASNLLGVILTPLLVVALMSGTSGVHVTGSAVVDILLQILLPFVLGQLSRRWTAGFVTRNKSWLKYVDQASIVLVVYSAFSSGMREHAWDRVSPPQLLVVLGVALVLLAIMLTATWQAARLLGFDRPDQIAIQFCGTKKSLATGLPMATVLFASQPVGLIVLPLMIFHQAQLMACSALAARYGRRSAELEAAAERPRA